jgi:hypothetical protein
MTSKVRQLHDWPRLVARLACCLLLGLRGALAPAASLTAQIEPDEVQVGDTVTFSLIFQGAAPPGNPGLPELPGFKVVPGLNQQTELDFNNPQNARYIYRYTLIPTQAGELEIPALQVSIGAQMLSTQPVKLRVTAANTALTPGNAPPPAVFLKLVAPKTNLFVGEALPVEVQLYWRQQINDTRLPQLKAEGFTLGASASPVQTKRNVGGQQYEVAIFKSSVTPAKSGLLTLGPAECSLSILVPVANPRRDLFDPFGMFGPRAQARPTTLTSEAVNLRVLPLPSANVPPTFNGAVGNFTLQVSASPTTLAVGDPITVRVQISGQGAIQGLTQPPQPQWRDFNLYPPVTTVNLTDTLGLAGTKIFTNVVIPLNHEIKELPPFQFSFFDPVAATYRTLSGPAIPLTVKPSGVTATVPPPVTNAVRSRTDAPPPDDILHIKARLDDLGPARRPLAQQGWFLALQGVPVLAWVSLLVRRRRAEALANNPRLRRQRETARRVREGLEAMRTHAAAKQSEQFFAALFRVLQEQLGERLDMPASAITEAVIDERLQPRGVPDDTCAALHELFQTCNLARYAPHKSRQELAALVPRVETVLRQLQQLPA